MKKLLLAIMCVITLAACVPDAGTPTPTTTTIPHTTTSVAPTTTTSTTTIPPAPGRFYIVGGKIIDPNGKIFYPVGANMATKIAQYETGYVFNWNGTGTGHSQDVLNWGWNTVRATEVCNPPANPGVAATQAGIDAFIDEYTAKKIVVMVECHDATGQNPTPTSSSLMAIYTEMDHLANKYKNNPYVWFDMLNEPQSDSNTANWLAVQKQTLARLRAIAPYNIFVADIPGYGQDTTTLTGGSALALGQNQCNVLYSWHAYGAITNYNDNFDEAKSRAAHKVALDYFKTNNIPVVIGEFGDPLTLQEGTAGPPAWNRYGAYAVMDYAPGDGVGLLWWHATGDSGNYLTYSLMADRHQAPWSAALNNVGTSAAGSKFWTVSHNKPNLGSFTGNLADSHCP